MIIVVEFVGSLRTLAKVEGCRIEFEEKATISTLIRRLRAEVFADDEFVDETNLLVMKNGKEISVAEGLQTVLKDKDTVALIPISHGG